VATSTSTTLFKNTNQGNYASAVYSDNHIGVTLGRVDDKKIKGMSGAWKLTLELARDCPQVAIRFDYDMFLTKKVDRKEELKTYVSFAGETKEIDSISGHKKNKNVFADGSSKKVGFGNVKAGTYDLVLGDYMHRNNNKNEMGEVRFGNIGISGVRLGRGGNLRRQRLL